MKRIHCYHGSPGFPADFHSFQEIIPAAQVVGVERGGRAGDGYFLGYSWGVNPAVRDASGCETCRGLILIAPYLCKSQKRSPLYFLLLRGILSLAPLRRKIVRGFLEKTAAPCAVPTGYGALASAIERQLFQAVKEKSQWDFDTLDALARMGRIPVLVVHGAADAVEGSADSVATLQRLRPDARLVSIAGAGHAIPWTHTKEICDAINGFISSSGGQRDVQDRVF